MKKLAFFLLTASLITACSSDDLSQDVTPAHAVNQLASSSVSVSNEGVLGVSYNPESSKFRGAIFRRQYESLRIPQSFT